MNMEMDPEDQRKAEESARQREEFEDKLALAWGEVANTGAGKFVLEDLMKRCNYHNSCVGNVNAPNPLAVVFQEGKRALFNHIMFYVRHDNERRKAR